MAVETADELRAILFDAYDGYADKRLKGPGHDQPFIVDDRTNRDLDARKELFLWFCQMFVIVQAPERIELTMRGGVPESALVEEWFQAHGQVTNYGWQTVVTPANLDTLEDLAVRIKRIVSKRYEVPAYKYVVPRTANSLRRLVAVLHKAWG